MIECSIEQASIAFSTPAVIIFARIVDAHRS
jgi:hypothetical protein